MSTNNNSSQSAEGATTAEAASASAMHHIDTTHHNHNHGHGHHTSKDAGPSSPPTTPPAPDVPSLANILSSTSMESERNASVNYKKRIMTDVPAPVWDYINSGELFDKDGLPNPDKLKPHLLKEGRVHPNDVIRLVNMAAEKLKQEPNLLILQDPITVCGDIHGQFYDLVELLRIGGDPKDGKYLFLGDYVDRGCFGTEVCLLLLSYKIKYPNTFYMIRGNHECRHLTAYFNFKQECLYKYNMDVYNAFMDCFDCLPLGAVLNGRFLCVHGGLSPEIKHVEDINHIDRFKEPPSQGAFCDLLWSDPMDEEEEESNPDATYLSNELRGCSYVFSYNAVSKFLRQNNLLSVIRAHEAQDEGYKLYKKGTHTGFPTCLCIFSAPNYCDVYNNKAAIIRFQHNLMNIRQFNCSPHPYYLPNFMHAFTWSLPFVVEKVMDLFQVILNLCDPSEDADTDEEDETPASASSTGAAGIGAAAAALRINKDRADMIKTKIRSVGRLCRMYSTLREEHESVLLLKGLAGGALPPGLLTQGPEAIRHALADFKNLDMANERGLWRNDKGELVSPTRAPIMNFEAVDDHAPHPPAVVPVAIKVEGSTGGSGGGAAPSEAHSA